MRLSNRAAFPVLAAILVVSWSSGFVGIRFATETATVGQVLFWRSLVSGIGLLPFALRAAPRITPALVWEQARYAVLAMVVYLGGFALAIDMGVSTGLVALTADLVPLAIAALSAPLLGQALTGRQWTGMLIGLAGVLVVSASALTLGSAPAFAYLLPVVAMVSFALSVLWQERRLGPPRASRTPREATPQESLTVVQRLCLQCLAAAAMFAPFAALTGGITPEGGGQFVFGIAWLVLVATYGSWLTYYYCLRRYRPAIVSSVIYLSPPVTMLWAWAMFGEPLTPAMAVGLGITFAGVALVTQRQSQPPTAPAPVMAPAD